MSVDTPWPRGHERPILMWGPFSIAAPWCGFVGEIKADIGLTMAQVLIVHGVAEQERLDVLVVEMVGPAAGVAL